MSCLTPWDAQGNRVFDDGIFQTLRGGGHGGHGYPIGLILYERYQFAQYRESTTASPLITCCGNPCKGGTCIVVESENDSILSARQHDREKGE